MQAATNAEVFGMQVGMTMGRGEDGKSGECIYMYREV